MEVSAPFEGQFGDGVRAQVTADDRCGPRNVASVKQFQVGVKRALGRGYLGAPR